MTFFTSLLLSLAMLPTLALAQSVDINTADAATLSRDLKGVGATRAQAIVEHRAQHGPFRSVDELALVKGIGPKVIEQNRPKLRVDRSPRAAGPAVSGPAVRSATPAAVRPGVAPRGAPSR